MHISIERTIDITLQLKEAEAAALADACQVYRGDAARRKLLHDLGSTLRRELAQKTGASIRVRDELTINVANVLCYWGIEFIEQLCFMAEVDLLKLPDLGKKSVTQIREVMHKHGLALGSRRA